MSKNNGLNQERVVVLGGTSGIGLATAHAAAARGAVVTVTSRSAERVARAARELGKSARGEVATSRTRRKRFSNDWVRSTISCTRPATSSCSRRSRGSTWRPGGARSRYAYLVRSGVRHRDCGSRSLPLRDVERDGAHAIAVLGNQRPEILRIARGRHEAMTCAEDRLAISRPRPRELPVTSHTLDMGFCLSEPCIAAHERASGFVARPAHPIAPTFHPIAPSGERRRSGCTAAVEISCAPPGPISMPLIRSRE
jgi:short chain dehydrogenase